MCPLPVAAPTNGLRRNEEASRLKALWADRRHVVKFSRPSSGRRLVLRRGNSLKPRRATTSPRTPMSRFPFFNRLALAALMLGAGAVRADAGADPIPAVMVDDFS